MSDVIVVVVSAFPGAATTIVPVPVLDVLGAPVQFGLLWSETVSVKVPLPIGVLAVVASVTVIVPLAPAAIEAQVVATVRPVTPLTAVASNDRAGPPMFVTVTEKVAEPPWVTGVGDWLALLTVTVPTSASVAIGIPNDRIMSPAWTMASVRMRRIERVAVGGTWCLSILCWWPSRLARSRMPKNASRASSATDGASTHRWYLRGIPMVLPSGRAKSAPDRPFPSREASR